MWLSDSFIGIYIIQTFLHSLVTAIIIERAINIWGITDPLAQFRYRIMTLILPVSMFPVYLVINHNRNSMLFRDEAAIFSLSRWLALEIWEVIPVSGIFMLVLIGTTIVFLVQEVIPIMRDYLRKSGGNEPELMPVDPAMDAMINDMCLSLDIEKPPVHIVADQLPFIYAMGAKNHSIIVSFGMLKLLDLDQLRSAVAHELAHIARRSNATTWGIFIMRVLMFFNPIALIVFRRVIQDDEHICDDITVSLTKDPHALAAALKIFYSPQEDLRPGHAWNINALSEGIETRAHNLLLKERITRLETSEAFNPGSFSLAQFLVTVSVIIVLNYFVV